MPLDALPQVSYITTPRTPYTLLDPGLHRAQSRARVSSHLTYAGMFLLTGGTAGGIFGGIVIAATGSLWSAAWVGVIASVFFAACIQIMMCEPRKAAEIGPEIDSKKTDATSPDDVAGVLPWYSSLAVG